MARTRSGDTETNPKRDGAFRRIIVWVADRPDVRTRTRGSDLAERADPAITLPTGWGMPVGRAPRPAPDAPSQARTVQ